MSTRSTLSNTRFCDKTPYKTPYKTVDKTGPENDKTPYKTRIKPGVVWTPYTPSGTIAPARGAHPLGKWRQRP